MGRKREIWVDDVKVIACILVVLGHFFQSMTKADLLPSNDLYKWFNQTIYYFHVSLFFICSGYLFQKFSCVDSVGRWRKNVLKKAFTLGVPYLTFSFITWFLKMVFASSTNDKIGGLFETLFLKPTSPYWYLYTLFFIFLITPTFKNSKMAITGLVIALAGKIVIISVGGYGIYAVSSVLQNEFWFVMGMCMSIVAWKTVKVWISGLISGIFLILSVVLYRAQITNGIVSFLMGIMACIAVIMFMAKVGESGKQNSVFGFLARYTLPIFLMHTLFAASFRSLLLKIGVESSAIHVLCGLAISFVGPIIAAEIMKKTKVLEFFLYPGKFVKGK